LFAATFIQRGRLRDLWDEVIYLDVPQEAAIARGARPGPSAYTSAPVRWRL
jgi:uridine kinase